MRHNLNACEKFSRRALFETSETFSGQPHSKMLAHRRKPILIPQGLGVRLCSAAFLPVNETFHWRFYRHALTVFWQTLIATIILSGVRANPRCRVGRAQTSALAT